MIAKIATPTPFAVGDVNCFLLKGDALTLVDAGTKTDEAYEALRRGLAGHGYSFKDIEQVFVTHHHPDHCGWVEAFDRAEIIGHQYLHYWLTRDADFMERHDRFYEQSFNENGVPEQYAGRLKRFHRTADFIGTRPLDRIIGEGEDLPGHPGWTVQESLGHAQSHLSLYHHDGRLIGGDLLLEKVSSNPLIEPPLNEQDERPHSLLQYNASLGRLLELPVDTVYGGHGGEIRNAHELIAGRLEKQQQRAIHVHELLKEQPHTVFELSKRLFPKVYEQQIGLTLSETLGQLDYLLSREMIEKQADEQGVFHYAAI